MAGPLFASSYGRSTDRAHWSVTAGWRSSARPPVLRYRAGDIAPCTCVSGHTSFCHAWFSSPGSCQFEFRLGRIERSRFGLMNRWSRKVMNVNVNTYECKRKKFERCSRQGMLPARPAYERSTCLDTVYCHFHSSWWSQAVWTCTKLVFCNCNLGCNRYLHIYI